jgi:hypothetical protein
LNPKLNQGDENTNEVFKLQECYRPVPFDLVRRCFNCLRTDYITTACRHVPRYLRCHREGQQAHTCNRPRSSESDGSLTRSQHPTLVVLNMRAGDVALAKPTARRTPRPPYQASSSRSAGSPTPSSPSPHSTPQGPFPSFCAIVAALPSTTTAPASLGSPQKCPRFEMWVIPCTAAMTATEDEHQSALVAFVGGARPATYPDQVAAYLLQHHGIPLGDAQIHRY